MKHETKILRYAHQQGEPANHAEKVAEIAAGDVYALSLLDSDGFPMPLGLPRYVIANGANFQMITGNEALELLSSLHLEE